MPNYVNDVPIQPSVAVHEREERFAVRRIYCVGRNYAAHAREMGKDPDREPPFFFSKPADTLVDNGGSIPYPPQTENLHFEIELVVAIGLGGREIDQHDSLKHIYGYAVGIDLTRRDMQSEAKNMGRPWDLAKGFDLSAPCGPVFPCDKVDHPMSGAIWLSVNDEVRQQGDLSELIWSVSEVISILSHSVELQSGDLIYTGTPAGVGAVQAGDRLTGGVDGIGQISFTIT